MKSGAPPDAVALTAAATDIHQGKWQLGISATSTPGLELGIDEYLRKRLMPVEGSIPRLAGIDMYGNSIPVGRVGGDLFEYINFQQRYNIDARVERAVQLSTDYMEPLPKEESPRNRVDAHVRWLESKSGYTASQAAEYRKAKSSEQVRIAEELQQLHQIAGVLLVDAQGHGIISAKIASTVHDTFHAFMLSELDRNGTTTPDLFEQVNLRLAQSVSVRNALGRDAHDSTREIATMLYGEIHVDGHFRLINFGHPPPLVFCSKSDKLKRIHKDRMAQFPALGLEIPEDHPDRNKYFSITFRKRQMTSSDVEELTLIDRGDIFFLYSDGAYDGSDEHSRIEIEQVIRQHKDEPAKEICNAILEYAVEQDDHLQRIDEADRIDDKTVFIIKRT